MRRSIAVRMAFASGFVLLGAPLLFAPTGHGFGLNAVLRTGDPQALRARVRAETETATKTAWTDLGLPALRAQPLGQRAGVSTIGARDAEEIVRGHRSNAVEDDLERLLGKGGNQDLR